MLRVSCSMQQHVCKSINEHRFRRTPDFTPQSLRVLSRAQSTGLHFYQNRQLELYAAKEARRLTLRQLVLVPTDTSSATDYNVPKVFYGRNMNEERLIRVRSNLLFSRHVPSVSTDVHRAPTTPVQSYLSE